MTAPAGVPAISLAVPLSDEEIDVLVRERAAELRRLVDAEQFFPGESPVVAENVERAAAALARAAAVAPAPVPPAAAPAAPVEAPARRRGRPRLRAVPAVAAVDVPAGLMAEDRAADDAAGLSAVRPGSPAPAAALPDDLDLAELGERDPEPPRFIIPEWLPAGYATLLAGHGGIGKSGIALALAVCIASGSRFFGLDVERRRVLYLSCEDKAEVLHWRLARTCEDMGIALASLHGHLSVLDMVGRDAVLYVAEDRLAGYGHPTPTFEALRARAAERRAQVVVLDGISDVYDGNENDRGKVKRFVNAMLPLADPLDGAVILIGHVDKATARGSGDTTEGYSGSTGWNNAVRARWYLRREVADDGDGTGAPTGSLILENQKANLSVSGSRLRLRYEPEAHAFRGEALDAPGRAGRPDESAERAGVLVALRALIDAGQYCPAAATGPRTAHHVLSQRPEFPESLAGAAGRRRFWRHLEALRRDGAVVEGRHIKPNRTSVVVLRLPLHESSNG